MFNWVLNTPLTLIPFYVVGQHNQYTFLLIEEISPKTFVRY